MQNRDLDTRLSAQEAEQAEFQSPVLRDYALCQRIRKNEADLADADAEKLETSIPSSADEISNTADPTEFATTSTLSLPAAAGGDVEAGMEFEVEALVQITSVNASAPDISELSIYLGGESSGLQLVTTDWSPAAANDYGFLRGRFVIAETGASGLVSGLATGRATGEVAAASNLITGSFDFDANPQPSITVAIQFSAAAADNVAELLYLKVKSARSNSEG